MADPLDERYVGYREHAEAQQRTSDELARLRERQATTEATLLHEMAAARSDIADVKRLVERPPQPPPQPVDHTALAMQRALDALSAQPRGGNPFITVFAIVGALAIGALVVLLFTGG